MSQTSFSTPDFTAFMMMRLMSRIKHHRNVVITTATAAAATSRHSKSSNPRCIAVNPKARFPLPELTADDG